MLSEPKITAFIPTVKPVQSKQFYMNILGLKLVSEDEYGLEFESNSTLLRVSIVQEFNPQPFTVLGFKIKGIIAQVEKLTKKGVIFERYSYFKQDNLGIWTSPSKAKIAWFMDPDGNLLSLTENAE